MHHAYLVIGSTTFIEAELHKLISEDPVDRITVTAQTIGIADVRALSEQAKSRPLKSAYRVIVIRTESLTPEAQNALLKLFEEPIPTTRFILTLPRDTLLPTLRSRVHAVAEIGPHTLDDRELSKNFCTKTYAERLAVIADLAKQKDDEALRSLARALVNTHATTHNSELLADLLLLSKFSELRGASKKMLLEQLALSLP